MSGELKPKPKKAVVSRFITTRAMAQTHGEGHSKPDQTTLDAAGELPVLDESGKEIPFRDLYNTEGRQVIVFIRHFFCGVSSHSTAVLKWRPITDNVGWAITALRRLRARSHQDFPTSRPRAYQSVECFDYRRLR